MSKLTTKYIESVRDSIQTVFHRILSLIHLDDDYGCNMGELKDITDVDVSTFIAE